jgi:hypothetical protein
LNKLEVEADDLALAWMAARPSADWLVAYDVHRCCGGGKICRVTVREVSPRDDRAQHATATLAGGTRILVDGRAAKRLPPHFGLTVRGLGPLKHLDLELTGEEWGELLYT